MCYYIALLVRGGGASAIDQVLRNHGRQARPLANLSIADALEAGKAQFLTTAGNCDCGTALAPATVDRTTKRTQQAAKLAKKGWSQAKVERWLVDREKADGRADERRHANTPDSVEMWSRVIRELMSVPGVQQAGLLLHFYSGDIERETIEPLRVTVPLQDFGASLQGLREDQLLMAA